MRRNYIILLLISSLLLVFTGALLKIMHWPFADALLLTGMLAGVSGVGLLLFKLLSKPSR